MPPNVGDRVSVIFYQGATTIFKSPARVQSVSGADPNDDVEVIINPDLDYDAVSAKVSELFPDGPNAWKLRLQVSIQT